VTPAEIDRFRRHLLARHRRAQAVAERFAAFQRRGEADPTLAFDVITHRCSAGRSGHHPVLAKVYVVEEGFLFSSRIKWAVADRVRISPWVLDSLLDRAAADFDLRDDAAVERVAEMIDGMRAEQHDRRWLANGQPAQWVRDVLDLPPDPEDGWLPSLWVRCANHPKEAEALDRDLLLRAARRGSTVR
jgi:hypothetical protein